MNEITQSLQAFQSINTLEIGAFFIPFLLAIYIDLSCHKSHEPPTIKSSAIWSSIWVLCSLLFGLFIWKERGAESFSLYLTGYCLEKVLSVDNLIVFALIFKSFGLASLKNQYLQNRILYVGIIGAIVFRIIFLGLGSFLVNLGPFVLIAFALVILWTVYKMWTNDEVEDEIDYTKHWSANLTKRIFKVTPSIESGKFFDKGMATPLFVCAFVVELADVAFSFDSVPVIVSVVKGDPYIAITASLWAAAGLRSLYFLLVAAQNKLWALEKAIVGLLVFVAGKLFASAFGFHIQNWISLTVVATLILGGILYSLFAKNPENA
jgi:tellurite resistance protein TerC